MVTERVGGRQKWTLRVGAALLGAALLSPAAAIAAPKERECALHVDGPYNSVGIYISHATSKSIADRVQPHPDGRPAATAQTVPCRVAKTVWHEALRDEANGETFQPPNSLPETRYDIWVPWFGSTNGLFLGTFHCIATPGGDSVQGYLCTHCADAHAGRIVVKFAY